MNISENKTDSKKTVQSRNWWKSLLIFAAVVIWFGTMSRFGFDAHHDGIMLGAAAAVAEGKLLFKEVFCQYGPLAVWIQSIPVWLFGAEDIVIKFTTVVFYGFIILLGAKIWGRFLKTPFNLLWYCCFLMLCPFYMVTFHPWSSVYALFFMLSGVELQLRFLEEEKTGFLFWAGVCATAAFLCRTPCGIVAFAAGAAVLILRSFNKELPDRFRSLVVYSAGAGAVCACFALYLTLIGAWQDYFRQCFTFIFKFVVKRGDDWSWTAFSDSMLPFTGASGYINFIFAMLPLLTAAVFLKTIRPFFYKKWGEQKQNLPLIAVLLLALGAWHQYFPVPCVRHLYWGAIPAFGVFALVCQKIWEWEGRSKALRISILVLLAVPLVYCVSIRSFSAWQYFEKKHQRITAQVPSIRGLWIFSGENIVFSRLRQVFDSLPPEIRKRGVVNHTPDGIYSALFPFPEGFDHPMFVNWGNSVYQDYNEAVNKLILEKKPSVLTTDFDSLPGYVELFNFKHFNTVFRFLAPWDERTGRGNL